jgi:hypothetical protein
MWLATSAEQAPEPVTRDFLETGLMVFEGDMTCCAMKHVFNGREQQCDRHALLLPILGLCARIVRPGSPARPSTQHLLARLRRATARSLTLSTLPSTRALSLVTDAELYSQRRRIGAAAPRPAKESDGSSAGDPAAPPVPVAESAGAIGHPLEEGIALAGDDLLAWLAPRKARAFPRKYAHSTPRGFKQVELFSNLLEMVEAMIDKPGKQRRMSGWLIGTPKTIPVDAQHGNNDQGGELANAKATAACSSAGSERARAALAAARQDGRRPLPPPGPALRSTRVAPEPPMPMARHRDPPPAPAAATAARYTAAADVPLACSGVVVEPSPRPPAERDPPPLPQTAAQGGRTLTLQPAPALGAPQTIDRVERDAAALTTAASGRRGARLRVYPEQR